MPTYNRLRRNPATGKLSGELIDEAVESFLKQDYPHRELLILNDTPGQELFFDKPTPAGVDVRVINFRNRYPTLGDKCNVGIAAATGKYITRWDDDDISLPDRLSWAMARVGDAQLLVVQGWFFEPRYGQLLAQVGTFGFTCDLVETHLAMQAPYATTSDCDEDQRFRRGLIGKAKRYEVFQPSLMELHYIYRWSSTQQTHFSANAGPDAYHKFGSQPIAEGTYEISPRWRRDYVAYADAAREAIAAGADHYEEPVLP